MDIGMSNLGNYDITYMEHAKLPVVDYWADREKL